jgi:hypothetical protein
MIVVIDNNSDKSKIENYSLLKASSIEEVLGLNIKAVLHIDLADSKKFIEYVYSIIIDKTYLIP